MALTKCKECGKQISTTAKTCPNCGAKNKKGMGCLTAIAIVALFFVAIGVVVGISGSGGDSGSISSPSRASTSSLSRASTLKTALSYLQDIEEVAWVDFVGNTVYVGFSKRPYDLDLIIGAAALIGNEAIDFGVHVWAVDGSRFNAGWRPGDGPYYKSVTARYGRIKR